MENQDEILFHKIEDYLKGQLSPESTKAFEAQIANDSNLKNQVQQQRAERIALRLAAKVQIGERLKKWEQEKVSSEKEKGRNRPRFFLWIGFLAISGFALVYFLSRYSDIDNSPTKLESIPPSSEIPSDRTLEKTPSQESKDKNINTSPAPESQRSNSNPPIAKDAEQKKTKLHSTPTINQTKLLAVVESLYEPDENLYSQNKSSEKMTTVSDFNEGVLAFKRDDFDTAITKFESIDKAINSDEYEISRKWLGHSLMSAKQYNAASPIFEELLKTATGTNIDRMEWYLTLSLLGDYTKNKERIDNLLEKMTDSKTVHVYFNKAKQLKGQIN